MEANQLEREQREREQREREQCEREQRDLEQRAQARQQGTGPVAGEGSPAERPEDDKEQPNGPMGRGGSLEPQEQPEIVDEASAESFPASDPPAWSPVVSP